MESARINPESLYDRMEAEMSRVAQQKTRPPPAEWGLLSAFHEGMAACRETLDGMSSHESSNTMVRIAIHGKAMGLVMALHVAAACCPEELCVSDDDVNVLDDTLACLVVLAAPHSEGMMRCMRDTCPRWPHVSAEFVAWRLEAWFGGRDARKRDGRMRGNCTVSDVLSYVVDCFQSERRLRSLSMVAALCVDFFASTEDPWTMVCVAETLPLMCVDENVDPGAGALNKAVAMCMRMFAAGDQYHSNAGSALAAILNYHMCLCVFVRDGHWRTVLAHAMSSRRDPSAALESLLEAFANSCYSEDTRDCAEAIAGGLLEAGFVKEVAARTACTDWAAHVKAVDVGTQLVGELIRFLFENQWCLVPRDEDAAALKRHALQVASNALAFGSRDYRKCDAAVVTILQVCSCDGTVDEAWLAGFAERVWHNTVPAHAGRETRGFHAFCLLAVVSRCGKAIGERLLRRHPAEQLLVHCVAANNYICSAIACINLPVVFDSLRKRTRDAIQALAIQRVVEGISGDVPMNDPKLVKLVAAVRGVVLWCSPETLRLIAKSVSLWKCVGMVLGITRHEQRATGEAGQQLGVLQAMSVIALKSVMNRLEEIESPPSRTVFSMLATVVAVADGAFQKLQQKKEGDDGGCPSPPPSPPVAIEDALARVCDLVTQKRMEAAVISEQMFVYDAIHDLHTPPPPAASSSSC